MDMAASLLLAAVCCLFVHINNPILSFFLSGLLFLFFSLCRVLCAGAERGRRGMRTGEAGGKEAGTRGWRRRPGQRRRWKETTKSFDVFLDLFLFSLLEVGSNARRDRHMGRARSDIEARVLSVRWTSAHRSTASVHPDDRLRVLLCLSLARREKKGGKRNEMRRDERPLIH